MTTNRALVIGLVAGEISGENLAVDLIDTIAEQTGHTPKLVGVGGDRLRERGLKSVFDASEIALIGLTSVIASLPRLIMRINQTARAMIAARPDVIILIDSPDFSHRVAKRLKKALPDVPVIKYVAPTVWAWRPERAAKMTGHIDHVLAILPFEPDIMKKLGGPPTHYVGHPLAASEDLAEIWLQREARTQYGKSETFDLLVLPGSRSGEIKALLPDFGKAVRTLHERGQRFRIHIPTLPKLVDSIKRETASWPAQPRITVAHEDKLEAFRQADAALAASGTVILELALAGVPVISCYRVDLFMRPFIPLITTWTAALPNVICDRPIVPEYLDYMIRPGMLARRIEELVEPNSLPFEVQMQGFRHARELMAVKKRPGSRAAEIILDAIANRTNGR
ncbi:MAG: lipid-A-disaccharide synthase [Ahrensia sp.]|nr:lipid-A-disaccharide synthase [Ahrensia sp.]